MLEVLNVTHMGVSLTEEIVPCIKSFAQDDLVITRK